MFCQGTRYIVLIMAFLNDSIYTIVIRLKSLLLSYEFQYKKWKYPDIFVLNIMCRNSL